jgi:hypothetical protein
MEFGEMIDPEGFRVFKLFSFQQAVGLVNLYLSTE